MPEWLLPLAGWFTAFVVAVGGIWFNRRKVAVDESALVLQKWKELSDSHKNDRDTYQADMKRLREEAAQDREKAEKVRARLEQELDDVRQELRDVRKELLEVRKASAEQILRRDQEIVSLKRELGQISQSTAVQIGRVEGKATKAKTRADANETRVDKLTTDKNDAHDAINENLERLNRMGDNSRKGTDEGEG